jgi:hypothetical protein
LVGKILDLASAISHQAVSVAGQAPAEIEHGAKGLGEGGDETGREPPRLKGSGKRLPLLQLSGDDLALRAEGQKVIVMEEEKEPG